MSEKTLNWWIIFLLTLIVNLLLIPFLHYISLGWQLFILCIIDFLIWVIARILGIEY